MHPQSSSNMTYGLLNCTLFLMSAVGTKQLGITFFYFFLNKNLSGLLFYYSCRVFSWCIFYGLKFIIGAGVKVPSVPIPTSILFCMQLN